MGAVQLFPWPWSARRSPATLRAAIASSTSRHSKHEDLRAIQFHYDVSNEFYALWLDDAMVYSCAYFDRQENNLEVAQRAELDHVCRKLQLQPGDRLLDIGCGWGALVMHAARHYGVIAHGVTLSEQQLFEADRRIGSGYAGDSGAV
jgi:cyclopropane-fatty-acyl-phospholipid synthase